MKQKRSKLLQFVWGNITMALDYVTCTKNLVEFGWMRGSWDVRADSQTNRQTDRQTNMLITVPRSRTDGGRLMKRVDIRPIPPATIPAPMKTVE